MEEILSITPLSKGSREVLLRFLSHSFRADKQAQMFDFSDFGYLLSFFPETFPLSALSKSFDVSGVVNGDVLVFFDPRKPNDKNPKGIKNYLVVLGPGGLELRAFLGSRQMIPPPEIQRVVEVMGRGYYFSINDDSKDFLSFFPLENKHGIGEILPRGTSENEKTLVASMLNSKGYAQGVWMGVGWADRNGLPPWDLEDYTEVFENFIYPSKDPVFVDPGSELGKYLAMLLGPRNSQWLAIDTLPEDKIGVREFVQHLDIGRRWMLRIGWVNSEAPPEWITMPPRFTPPYLEEPQVFDPNEMDETDFPQSQLDEFE